MAAKYKIIVDAIDKDQWRNFACSFGDYSIYQSWGYQQVRSESDGQGISRIVIVDKNDQPVTMAQVRIKDCSLLGLRIGYVQWGPLLRRADGDTKCSVDVLKILQRTCMSRGINVLRFMPNACDDEQGIGFAGMLKESGFEFVKSVKPYRTMMLSVEGDDDQLRSRFHRSWRRGLKKAEQSGLDISESLNGQSFKLLEELYLEAKKRKGFKGLNPREFVRTQQLLSDREKMNVVAACYEGHPVAIHATGHFGDTAVGALAASSQKGLEFGASYLVWWKTLLAARDAGMKRYDLGGIDPEKNPSVYQFKMRMGAREENYIGAFEICSSKRVKSVWRSAEKIYWLIKRRD